MTDTILLVDDEAALNRTHARLLAPLLSPSGTDAPAVAIELAESGMEAEAYLLAHPDCAVVVADLRMPGMDGLALLERTRTIAPDAVRILATGNAEVHSAIEAINRASIFRLLTKPCSGLALRTAVADALKQHHLVIAERQLLEDTLRGSVRVLVEILTLIDPVGSSRALRIHRYVSHIIRTLSIQDGWTVEVAAMLSHLGSLTLTPAAPAAGPDAAAPPAAGPQAGDPAHASAGYELLKHIPRLDVVASIIARQGDAIDAAYENVPLAEQDPVRRGGRVLRVAIEFDAALTRGRSREAALGSMRQRPSEFDRTVVDSLRDIELPELVFESRVEALSDLRVGMILDEDLFNPYGVLMMPRGQEITPPVILRLTSFAAQDLRKRARVLAPKG